MRSFDFALSKTSFPENMGSAARALAVMGFSQLSFIAPHCDPSDIRAAVLASHAADTVLASAKVYSDVAQWSCQQDLIIGLSARSRELGPQPIMLTQLESVLKDPKHAQQTRVGILFGSERAGLDNHELSYCHYVCQIPTPPHTQYRSLNLAQSVQLVSYTCMLIENAFQSHLVETHDSLQFIQAKASFDRFLTHLVQSELMKNFRQRTTAEQTLRRLRMLFQHSIQSQEDLDFVYGFLKTLMKDAQS